MSEAAVELKTWERREWVKSSLETLCRKASLLHKIQEHIEGQLRDSRGMVFEMCLDSFQNAFAQLGTAAPRSATGPHINGVATSK